MAAESFDYEQVKAQMDLLIAKRDEIRSQINAITEEIEETVTNTTGNGDRALGGEIAPIKNRWNTFLDGFNQFSTGIENIALKVSGTSASASATNKAFEQQYKTDFTSNVETSETAE